MINIFKGENQNLEFSLFIKIIKDYFPMINDLIKEFLSAKFFKSENLNLPKLSNSSKVLTKELLPLFYLSNNEINKCPSLSLLYSAQDNFNLKHFLKTIIKTKQSILIMVKYLEEKIGIFISSKRKLNESNYIQDEEISIFHLYPKFKQFFPQINNNKSVAFFNIKDEDNEKGFGIGTSPNFKIWIDENMKENSYINDNDEIFEKEITSKNDLDPIKKIIVK